MLDVAVRMTNARPVATRSSKVSAPTAGEVPVTRAMLGQVRTEVVGRVNQAREGEEADAQRLDAKIDTPKAELQAELQEVKAVVHTLLAQGVRIEVLLEQQIAQTRIILEGIAALLSRQNQIEQRVTVVEDTVRKLASAQPRTRGHRPWS